MPFNTLFSWWIGRRMDRINDFRDHPIVNQERTLSFLLLEGAQTAYGKKDPTLGLFFWTSGRLNQNNRYF